MPPASTARRRPVPTGRRPAVVLALLGAWAIAVPWLARALGLALDVPTRLEVIDHVVPGLVVLACSGLLGHPRTCGAPGSLPRLALLGVCALSGIWITATHLTLVPEALDGTTGWGPALMHLSAGPAVVVAALAALLAEPGR